jgi:hypothetical protein
VTGTRILARLGSLIFASLAEPIGFGILKRVKGLFYSASDYPIKVLAQLLLLDPDDLASFCLFACAAAFDIVHW